MANIVLDEKRFPRIGEVSAIKLKNIKPVHLNISNYPNDLEDSGVDFWAADKGISEGEEVTFIKYVGGGMFIDLISDQVMILELLNSDDFGSDEFHSLDEISQKEVDSIPDISNPLRGPDNLDDLKSGLALYTKNPLVIDGMNICLMSIDSNIAYQFASQSIEDVRNKLLKAKEVASNNLQQDYMNNENAILKMYEEKAIAEKGFGR